MDKVLVRMPQSSYDLVMETLEMDSHSSMFDQDLRDEITCALGTVKEVGAFYMFVTDEPMDQFSSCAYATKNACHRAAGKVVRAYQEANTQEDTLACVMFIEIQPDGETKMDYVGIDKVAKW